MKTTSNYICQQCGYQSPSFMGKCPECGEWNSLVETKVAAEGTKRLRDRELKFESNLYKLSDVKALRLERIPTGYLEFDRVLGGGIVPGSIVLISGDPGIGKSTLLLQAAMAVASVKVTKETKEPKEPKVQKTSDSSGRSTLRVSDSMSSSVTSGTSVLYVTGEESAQQVKIRADRIAKKLPDNLFILPETSIDSIIAAAQKISPKLLICDSIQTLTSDELSGIAGSVGQVRQCAQTLQRLAKTSQIPVFLVGHVTKEGNIAGPKVLEHLVDAVLNLEGDGMHAYRILRSVKNRFGSTFEVGVFEMADEGILEVENASGIFLAERISSRPGSVVTATIAGGRPILAEVQALVSQSVFAVPTRRVTGLDISRTQVVIAALSKAVKLNLSNLDIFVNVAGGLRISEPSVDLPSALAIVSAVLDKPVKEGICAFGEVGLLGEIRNITNTKSRFSEAKRLGFGDFVTPEKFKTLEAAVSYAIKEA